LALCQANHCVSGVRNVGSAEYDWRSEEKRVGRELVSAIYSVALDVDLAMLGCRPHENSTLMLARYSNEISKNATSSVAELFLFMPQSTE
jgi:hypothetical protein